MAGLVTSGPFAVVRHPIYLGGLGLFGGYSLLTSIPALALTAALVILWAGKIRVEERLLVDVYDEYPAYCERVRRRMIRSSTDPRSYNRPMAWPDSVERVAAFLRAAGAEARLEELGADTSTAQAAADAVGCALGQIVKSLVLVCDGRAVIALVPGDRRVDPAKVALAAGADDARVARPPEVVAATGFVPGAVAPVPASRRRGALRRADDPLERRSSGSGRDPNATWRWCRRSSSFG